MSRQKVATIFSEVFSPFITAGLLLLAVTVETDNSWLIPLAIQLVFIIGIPLGLSIWMHRTGRTTDRFVKVRKQRTPLYIASLLSWITGALLINVVDTTHAVQLLVNLFTATLLLVTVINLKIKVSIHALSSALFALVIPLYLGSAALGYAVGFCVWTTTVWSRHELKRHSTLELILGTVIGSALAIVYMRMK